LIQRNIQKLKIVSNGLRCTTEERLAILELRMLLRPGNSFQLTIVKIPIIMCMTWIQNWTQMLNQLLRVQGMVKTFMAITILIDLPANLTLMEITPESNQAMVAMVVMAAMVARAAMAAMVAKAAMADTVDTVVKVAKANSMKQMKNSISLAEATLVTIPILMEPVVTIPIHILMEVKVAMVAKVATRVAMAAMVAKAAMVATVAIKAIPITTMVTSTLMT
jgi:hypothetical protein